jgi:hypothetical protein
MGCCSTKRDFSETMLLSKKIQNAIQRNSLKTLKVLTDVYMKSGEDKAIDKPFAKIEDIDMNLLAFAIYSGKIKSFIYILETLGASIKATEDLLRGQNKSCLEIICENGHIEILDYFLTNLAENWYIEPGSVLDTNITMNFERSTLVQTETKINYTPIQIACFNGFIQIIEYVFRHFENKFKVPYLFDINYQEDYSGENCAMIACRKGDHTMVKFLYEFCKANFKAINKRSENVLIITAAASKKKITQSYYEIFVYLIEVVKLEFGYMHEEILLLLEDQRIIKYYQKKLLSIGIKVEKKDIEKKYAIQKPDIPLSRQDILIDQLGENFEIKKYLRESESTESIISSVRPEELASTPFISVLGPDGGSASTNKL